MIFSKLRFLFPVCAYCLSTILTSNLHIPKLNISENYQDDGSPESKYKSETYSFKKEAFDDRFHRSNILDLLRIAVAETNGWSLNIVRNGKRCKASLDWIRILDPTVPRTPYEVLRSRLNFQANKSTMRKGTSGEGLSFLNDIGNKSNFYFQLDGEPCPGETATTLLKMSDTRLLSRDVFFDYDHMLSFGDRIGRSIEIFPAFLTFKIIVKNRDGPQISHKFVKEQFYDFMIESDMIRNVLPGDEQQIRAPKWMNPLQIWRSTSSNVFCHSTAGS